MTRRTSYRHWPFTLRKPRRLGLFHHPSGYANSEDYVHRFLQLNHLTR